MKQTIYTLVAMTMGIVASQAAITYVDAEEGASGNTYATGGSLGDTSWVGGATSNAIEDQWSLRTGFATDSTIFQGRHSLSPDDMPELTTEITGLADGDYDVWVFFWDASGSNTWTIDAGLTSGALTTYSADGPGNTTAPVATSTLSFTNTPSPTEDDRIFYGVNLGQATVTSGSTIDVFIDNLTGGNSNTRTWYDGVGFEAVVPVPEPSSTALLGLGGLALIIRRRR